MGKYKFSSEIIAYQKQIKVLSITTSQTIWYGKSQVAMCFLRNTSTDPLDRQLDSSREALIALCEICWWLKKFSGYPHPDGIFALTLKFCMSQVKLWYFQESEKQRRRSDCADAQADLCLCC